MANWNDIVNNPAWASATPAQQDQVRRRFYDVNVSPMLAESGRSPDELWDAFFARTGGVPSSSAVSTDPAVGRLDVGGTVSAGAGDDGLDEPREPRTVTGVAGNVASYALNSLVEGSNLAYRGLLNQTVPAAELLSDTFTPNISRFMNRSGAGESITGIVEDVQASLEGVEKDYRGRAAEVQTFDRPDSIRGYFTGEGAGYLLEQAIGGTAKSIPGITVALANPALGAMTFVGMEGADSLQDGDYARFFGRDLPVGLVQTASPVRARRRLDPAPGFGPPPSVARNLGAAAVDEMVVSTAGEAWSQTFGKIVNGEDFNAQNLFEAGATGALSGPMMAGPMEAANIPVRREAERVLDTVRSDILASAGLTRRGAKGVELVDTGTQMTDTQLVRLAESIELLTSLPVEQAAARLKTGKEAVDSGVERAAKNMAAARDRHDARVEVDSVLNADPDTRQALFDQVLQRGVVEGDSVTAVDVEQARLESLETGPRTPQRQLEIEIEAELNIRDRRERAAAEDTARAESLADTVGAFQTDLTELLGGMKKKLRNQKEREKRTALREGTGSRPPISSKIDNPPSVSAKLADRMADAARRRAEPAPTDRVRPPRGETVVLGPEFTPTAPADSAAQTVESTDRTTLRPEEQSAIDRSGEASRTVAQRIIERDLNAANAEQSMTTEQALDASIDLFIGRVRGNRGDEAAILSNQRLDATTYTLQSKLLSPDFRAKLMKDVAVSSAAVNTMSNAFISSVFPAAGRVMQTLQNLAREGGQQPDVFRTAQEGKIGAMKALGIATGSDMNLLLSLVKSGEITTDQLGMFFRKESPELPKNVSARAREAIFRVRENIDNGSQIIVDNLRTQIAAMESIGITPDDPRMVEMQRELKDVRNGVGTYLTTVYDVHRDKNYAKRVYEGIKSGDAAFQTMRENIMGYLAERYFKLRDGISAIKDHNNGDLQRTAEDVANNLTPRQIDRFYEDWVGDPRGVSGKGSRLAKATALVDAMERLAGQDGPTSNDYMNRIFEILDIGARISVPKNDATFIRQGRGDDRNLRQRERIPPAIRQLRGEVTDAIDLVIETQAAVARTVSSLQATTLLVNDGMGRWLFPQRPSDDSVTWRQIPTGAKGAAAYGAMAGMWVRQDIFELLQPYTVVNTTFVSALKSGSFGSAAIIAASSLQSWIKLKEVVVGVSAPIMNTVGTVTSMLDNGNTSKRSLIRAADVLSRNIGRSMRTTADPEYLRLVANGTLDEGVQIRELVDLFKRWRKHDSMSDAEAVREMSKDPARFTANMLRTIQIQKDQGLIKASEASSLVFDVYQFSENLGKAANYFYELDAMTTAARLDRMPLNAAQIESIVAERTKRSNFSWSRTAPLAKSLEKGLITFFGTYIAETFRIKAGSLAIARKDWKAAKEMSARGNLNMAAFLRKSTTKRSLGVATTTALFSPFITTILGAAGVATGAVSSLVLESAREALKALRGDDESIEEEIGRIEAARDDSAAMNHLSAVTRSALVHTFMGSMRAAIAAVEDDGTVWLVDSDRIDANGPASVTAARFINALMAEEDPVTTAAGVLFDFVTEDYLGGGPVGKFVFNALAGRSNDSSLRRRAPETYDAAMSLLEMIGVDDPDRANQAIALLDKALLPGDARRLTIAIEQAQTNENLPDTVKALSLAMIPVYRWNVMESLSGSERDSFGFQYELSKIRDARSSEIANHLTHTREFNPEAFSEAFERIVELEREAYAVVQPYVTMARTVGRLDGEIEDALRSNSAVNVAASRNLVEGTFQIDESRSPRQILEPFFKAAKARGKSEEWIEAQYDIRSEALWAERLKWYERINTED